MHLMGDDFWYSESSKNFRNMDMLIDYINKNDKFNMKISYSTPSIYM